FSALDLAALQRALREPAALVVFESPVNPTLRNVDVAAVAQQTRAAGARTVLDGPFAPPPLPRPPAPRGHLVVHSATKFFGGHSDVLAGVVAGRHELLAPIEAFRRRTGAVLAPDPAWLLCRSWPTLDLRLRSQQETAAALAQALRRDVAEGRLLAVAYPGADDHPDRALVQRQMGGGGCMVSFVVP